MAAVADVEGLVGSQEKHLTYEDNEDPSQSNIKQHDAILNIQPWLAAQAKKMRSYQLNINNAVDKAFVRSYNHQDISYFFCA